MTAAKHSTATLTTGKSDSYHLLKAECADLRQQNALLRESLRIANERIDAERRRADLLEESKRHAWRTAVIWTAPKQEA